MHHQQWRKEPNPLEIHNYKQEIWNYQWIQTLHKTPVMPAELGFNYTNASRSGTMTCHTTTAIELKKHLTLWNFLLRSYFCSPHYYNISLPNITIFHIHLPTRLYALTPAHITFIHARYIQVHIHLTVLYKPVC